MFWIRITHRSLKTCPGLLFHFLSRLTSGRLFTLPHCVIMRQHSSSRETAQRLLSVVGLLAAATSTMAQETFDNCTVCNINPLPVGGLTIGWQAVDITAITVATATIIIDTAAGLTSTKTAPVATITADENGNPILDDEALETFWSSKVVPASAVIDLTVVDGTPTATVTASMTKGPGSATVVTGTM